MTIPDFDTVNEDAWREFRADLADRLFQLPVGSEVAVGKSTRIPDGPRSVITFTFTRARRLRATMNWDSLHRSPKHFVNQLISLEDAGWRTLLDGRRIYEVPRRRADELASVAVEVLRQVCAIVHPAMLAADAAIPREDVSALGCEPTSRAELQAWVRQLVEELAKQPVHVDDDGAIEVTNVGVTSQLHVWAHGPVLQFQGTVIEQVGDVATAKAFIADEAATWGRVKLVLQGTALIAFMKVDVPVFHPTNFHAVLERWLHFVDQGVPKILAAIPAVSGSVFHDPTEVPDQLLNMLPGESERERLSAAQVAAICRYDQALILSYLTIAHERWLRWLRAIAEAESRDSPQVRNAEDCRAEARVWDMLIITLREALWHTVFRGKGIRGALPASE